MSLDKMIDRANELKAQIDANGKFDPKILKKLNYKFRLDWNYYSNHMEGGTLTKEETRSVMVDNINISGKPLKDVLEMKGHDQVVQEILSIGKAESRISEKRMKDIHSAIMYEDDPSKRKSIGNWKETPNHLINYKGEKIEFTLPGDVPNEIHDLLNGLNAELDKIQSGKSKLHPIILASQFHIDFVTIHPFYDGNGRMVRILTNLILISCGFPPIIIRESDKDNYYKILADIQVYGGTPDLFYKSIITGVVNSQLLTLTALEGFEIDEPDDLDKEIDLFKREIEINQSVGTQRKNDELIAQLYKVWIEDLLFYFESKHNKFDDLFTDNQYDRSYKVEDDFSFMSDNENWIPFNIDDHFESVKKVEGFKMTVGHEAYKKKGMDLFSLSHNISILFEKYKFSIKDDLGFKVEMVYSQVPAKSEMDKWINEMIKNFLEMLKVRSNRN